MSNLMYLDMSNNRFGGSISQCFGKITSYIKMIGMGNNKFLGTNPNVYGDCASLEGLSLNGNQLRGEVPSSLSKCSALSVLDLGNNHLNGTFSGWLGDLPNLQALVLKSNNFHGRIQPSSTVEFPFPRVDQAFPQISVDYTIIDMSNNTFEGQIPRIIGGLSSLIVLNLSHNNLIGPIPHEGPQFSTFDTSFGGNSGLYGSPLPKREHQDDGGYDDGEESGFTWKVVTLGYGCGTLVGLVMEYLMLSTRKVKWFNTIADAGKHMVLMRNKRRYVHHMHMTDTAPANYATTKFIVNTLHWFFPSFDYRSSVSKERIKVDGYLYGPCPSSLPMSIKGGEGRVLFCLGYQVLDRKVLGVKVFLTSRSTKVKRLARVKRMASINTRLNIKKLNGNIVQKHGGSKQVGFKQLGPGVEAGVHEVDDEKRVWFNVELQGAQGDRKAKVFRSKKRISNWWKIKTGNVLNSCNQRPTQQCMKSEVTNIWVLQGYNSKMVWLMRQTWHSLLRFSPSYPSATSEPMIRAPLKPMSFTSFSTSSLLKLWPLFTLKREQVFL
nr:leucine-rich repeat-containing protein [Tanacetum cinerariifolium]